MERFRLLKPEEIEVRVGQVRASGATALLYKTARVDYEILDESLGAENWQCDYQEIKGNLYCTISIWDAGKGQWIRKQNCGIESREDGNGNEKKGEASDAMKRAGFTLGIGRELYSSPFIWLNVSTKQDGGKYIIVNGDGKPSYDKYVVTEIDYDKNRRINRLVIANQRTGEIVYRHGIAQKKDDKPKKDKAKVEAGSIVPAFDSETAYKAFISKWGITPTVFTQWRNFAAQDAETGVQKWDFMTMTPAQWQETLIKLDTLAGKGYFNE